MHKIVLYRAVPVLFIVVIDKQHPFAKKKKHIHSKPGELDMFVLLAIFITKQLIK